MSLIFDMLTHRVWKKIHPTHLFYITIFHPPRLFKSPRLIFLNNFLPTTFIQDPTFIRDIRVAVIIVLSKTLIIELLSRNKLSIHFPNNYFTLTHDQNRSSIFFELLCPQHTQKYDTQKNIFHLQTVLAGCSILELQSQ